MEKAKKWQMGEKGFIFSRIFSLFGLMWLSIWLEFLCSLGNTSATSERLLSRKPLPIIWVCKFLFQVLSSVLFFCFQVDLCRVLLPFFLNRLSFFPGHQEMIMLNYSKASLAGSSYRFLKSKTWNCFQKLLIGLSWLSMWLVTFWELLSGCLFNPPITVLLI